MPPRGTTTTTTSRPGVSTAFSRAATGSANATNHECGDATCAGRIVLLAVALMSWQRTREWLADARAAERTPGLAPRTLAESDRATDPACSARRGYVASNRRWTEMSATAIELEEEHSLLRAVASSGVERTAACTRLFQAYRTRVLALCVHVIRN